MGLACGLWRVLILPLQFRVLPLRFSLCSLLQSRSRQRLDHKNCSDDTCRMNYLLLYPGNGDCLWATVCFLSPGVHSRGGRNSACSRSGFYLERFLFFLEKVMKWKKKGRGIQSHKVDCFSCKHCLKCIQGSQRRTSLWEQNEWLQRLLASRSSIEFYSSKYYIVLLVGISTCKE